MQPVKKLGDMVWDKSDRSVQISSGFKTSDMALSPLTSPLSYAGTIIRLEVPENAVEIIVNPNSDMRISEDSAMTSYDVIAADTKEAIGVSNMKFVYIVQDSGNGTLNFRFSLI